MKAAQKLTAWRLAKGYTQAEAAALMGVSQAAWSTWEGGKTRPELEAILVLERITRRTVRLRDWLKDAPAPAAATGTDD